jgi:hypothetical protein
MPIHKTDPDTPGRGIGPHRSDFEQSNQGMRDFPSISQVCNIISAANEDPRLHAMWRPHQIGFCACSRAPSFR